MIYTAYTQEELGPGLTERMGSRNLVNARIGYQSGRYMLQLYATNLLDENELIGQSLAFVRTDTGTLSFRPAPLGEVLQPQTIGVGVDIAL